MASNRDPLDTLLTLGELFNALCGIRISTHKQQKIEAAVQNCFDHYQVTEKELYAHLRIKHLNGELRPRIAGVTSKEGAERHEVFKNRFR